MKVQMLIIFFLLNYQCVLSQKIDSLERILSSSQGIKRCDALYALNYELIDVDNEASINYGNAAFICSLHFNDSLRIVRNGRYFASALRRLGKLDSAIIIYNLIIPIALRNQYSDDLRNLYNSSGVTYTFMADYAKGLNCHFQALKLNIDMNDSLRIAHSMNNIGLIYYKLKNYTKAFEYYKRCYSLSAKIEAIDVSEQVKRNIGLCYTSVGELDSALLSVETSIKYCYPNCSEQSKMEVEFIKGIIEYNLMKFEEAKAYFLDSYRKAQVLIDERYQLDNLMFLAKISIKLSLFDDAIRSLKLSEKIVQNNPNYSLESMNTYLQLSLAYGQMFDFKNQAFYQSKHITLKDSIYHESKIKDLMEQEARYLEEKNLSEISLQKQTLALNEGRIRRQYFLSGLMVCMVFMAISIIVLLYKRFKQKQLANFYLDLKVGERTKKLEEYQELLVRLSKDQNMIIQKSSNELNIAISRIAGLCDLGLNEVTDQKTREYISEFNSAAEQLKFINKTLLDLNNKE